VGARKEKLMAIKMKELPTFERPYEKLETYGEQSLSNSELLAIIIKTGTKQETAIMLAQRVLGLGKGEELRCIQDISLKELKAIKGIGRVKAIQLKAVCELAKRMSNPIKSRKIRIKNSLDVANLFMEELRFEKREHAKLLLLNTKNDVIKIVDIAYGGRNFASIEPKEILQEVLQNGAGKFILVHNHPSGDPTPSQEDYRTNDRIYEAADVMGIKLLDHVVIGDGKYKSLLYEESKRKER
jgi:DNA repair protein RadC